MSSSQIVNLTPHPVHIFAADCPDRIAPGSYAPIAVIPPAGDLPPARLGAEWLGRAAGGLTVDGTNIPVDIIKHTTSTVLPEKCDGIWFLVSLVVALANPNRADLVVPNEAVRDLTGSVLGCRTLAITVKSTRVVVRGE